MSREPIITAIDVGTDKCVTLVAAISPDTNNLKVLGVSAVPSKGMKKSQIIDLDKVLATVTESLDGAERMAGLEIKSAYVSVSGSTIKSLNSKGVVAVASSNQEITEEDVQRVTEAARAISLSSDREIIHVIPRDFKVDSQEGVKDPVGMTGVRLESETHIITGMSTALKNMEKCIQDLGVTVDGFVFSGLAAAEVVLSETEKELGVVVVDIGSGSTSLAAYVDGSLEYTTCLPIGARHITQDIALGCRISIDAAEKIKMALSSEKHAPIAPTKGESKKDLNLRRKKADELKLSQFDESNTDDTLSKRTVIEGIMYPRIQEIFQLVKEKLSAKNLLPLVPAGLVITGGGAETVGIVEIAKKELNLPARKGTPVKLEGLVGDIQKPSYATSIGLLMFGKQNVPHQAPSSFNFPAMFGGFPGKSIGPKLKNLFSSLLP